MNKAYITAILAVTALAFSEGAMALTMSESEYKTAEKNISAEYESAKKQCLSFSSNAKDLCMAEARRAKKAAKSELNMRFKPAKKTDNKMTATKLPQEKSNKEEIVTTDHLRRP